jgi:hypothetical protein
VRIADAASLEHLSDVANGGEVPTTNAIRSEVAAFRLAAQGRYLDPVAEYLLAGLGQGNGVIVNGGAVVDHVALYYGCGKPCFLDRRVRQLTLQNRRSRLIFRGRLRLDQQSHVQWGAQ